MSQSLPVAIERHLRLAPKMTGSHAFCLLVGLAAATLGPGAWPAQATGRAQAADRTAFVGASVLDIDRGTLNRETIITRGDRIEAIIDARAAIPRRARVVHVDGLYATPGLIDAHKHIAIGQSRHEAKATLRRELFSGVTAIRDMGGDVPLIAKLDRAGRSGSIPAPDIYYSAFFAGPGYFEKDRRMAPVPGEGKPGSVPWLQEIRPGTDLHAAVAVGRKTGATGVKLYANFDPAIFRALVAEAHRQGMPVWAHAAIFPTTPLEVAESGVETVEHVCMIAYQAAEIMPQQYHDRPPFDERPLFTRSPNPAIAQVLGALKAHHTILDATLFIYPTIERMRARIGPEHGPPIYCSSALAEHLARQAYRAGIEIAAGTDAFTDGATPYPALFEELSLLRDKAGLSPIDTLRAATRNAADALGKGSEMGSLSPGKLADIAFFSVDPLKPNAEFRSVALTVKRGHIYWRKDYVPITAADLEE
jgi:imidazolonepropionase-like amidohydrolase